MDVTAMKKLYRSRRALSPVLSAVLMMLVVMVGMSLLFGFFVNYAGNFQSGDGSAVLESMVVEDVHIVPENVTIWVYNLGKIPFNISKVYINGALASVPLSLDQVVYNGTKLNPTPNEIKEGAHAEISINSPTQLFFGGVYTFKIVTLRGTTLEVTEDYP